MDLQDEEVGLLQQGVDGVVLIRADNAMPPSEARWRRYGDNPKPFCGKANAPRSARGTTSPESVSRPPFGK